MTRELFDRLYVPLSVYRWAVWWEERGTARAEKVVIQQKFSLFPEDGMEPCGLDQDVWVNMEDLDIPVVSVTRAEADRGHIEGGHGLRYTLNIRHGGTA